MINLNPSTQLSLDEAREKLSDYKKEQKELEFKDKFGMPMSDDEKGRYEVIAALVEQMEFIIDWMIITDEDDYNDWSVD